MTRWRWLTRVDADVHRVREESIAREVRHGCRHRRRSGWLVRCPGASSPGCGRRSGRSPRPRRRPHAQPPHRRRPGRRGRRSVGGSRPRADPVADPRARSRDVRHVHRGQEPLRTRRSIEHVSRGHPQGQSDRAHGRATGDDQVGANGPHRVPGDAVDGVQGHPLGRRDGGVVDQTPHGHPTRPITHRVGLRSRLGRRSVRRVIVALPRVLQFGGQPREPDIDRGRRPAEPGRRRFAARRAGDGPRAR